MMKTYWHATLKANFDKMLKDGQINPGFDGIVYLTEKMGDAMNFLRIRLPDDLIVAIQLTLDENDVFETFDHNEKFFGCEAFGVNHPISIEKSMVCAYVEKKL